MKYVKILGLAAVAAMAVMAFAGAGSASASVLCKTTVNTCPAAWDWASGTAISGSLKSASATLEAGSAPFEIQDTCTTASVAGTTSNTGSSTETVEGPITTLTFDNCSAETVVLAKGKLEVHANGDTGGGILTGKENRVTVVAFGFISCVANTGAGTNLGTIDEPANASSDAVATINATIPLTGSGCPANARWTAEYTITSPTPLYVSTG